MSHDNELIRYGTWLKQCRDQGVYRKYERLLTHILIFAKFRIGGNVFHEKRLEIAQALRTFHRELEMHDAALAEMLPTGFGTLMRTTESNAANQHQVANLLVPFIEELFDVDSRCFSCMSSAPPPAE